MRLDYEIGYCSKSGCMSKSLLDLIVCDATTGKTFDAIAKGVGCFRFGLYLTAFEKYKRYTDNYNKRRLSLSSLAEYTALDYNDFGAFDNLKGLNENLGGTFSNFLYGFFVRIRLGK